MKELNFKKGEKKKKKKKKQFKNPPSPYFFRTNFELNTSAFCQIFLKNHHLGKYQNQSEM